MKTEQIRLVEEKLGENIICARCGATLATFAEACTAALNERCPGFEAIEGAAKNGREPT